MPEKITGILRHHGDGAAQRHRIEFGDIDAVEADDAFLRRKKRSISWKTVDLPAPDGPTSATASPGAMVSEKSCSAAASGRVG